MIIIARNLCRVKVIFQGNRIKIHELTIMGTSGRKYCNKRHIFTNLSIVKLG